MTKKDTSKDKAGAAQKTQQPAQAKQGKKQPAPGKTPSRTGKKTISGKDQQAPGTTDSTTDVDTSAPKRMTLPHTCSPVRTSLQWREAAEEVCPCEKYPRNYQEAQMTFLSNRLETAQAGYERQQVIGDSNRKEVLEWKTKFTLSVAEGKLNRDGLTFAEATTSKLRKELEAITMARDKQVMTRNEDKSLQDSLDLIAKLTAERDEAILQRDTCREDMRRQQSEHSHRQAELMAKAQEHPLYLPGSSVHQTVKPSKSEILYHSPWEVNQGPLPTEQVQLHINHQVS